MSSTEIISDTGIYPVSKTSKIVRYFPDSDLRSGHLGLAKIARKNKVNVEELAAGEYCIFTNRKKTDLKMYVGGNIVAHYKSPRGHRINPKVIRIIPLFFNGREIDYDAALTAVMKREFPDLQ